MKKRTKKSEQTLTEFLARDAEVQELRKKVGGLERQLKKARAQESNIIEAVVAALTDSPPRLVAPPVPTFLKKGLHETAILHISDVQLGKVTETYDTAKAEERVLLTCRKAIEVAEIRRSFARIDEIHVYLGGDMIEGEDVFATQAHEIDSSVYDQACVNGPAIFAKAILLLLGSFEKVVVCSVPGNHGRNGSPHTRAHPRTNWDQVLYNVTRTLLLGSPAHPRKELAGRLTFNLSERFWIVDRVYGWGNLLVHGHQISGGFAGFPWYGASKKAWGWIDSIPETWERLWFGHFHTPVRMTLNKREIFANGTTESDNVYAQEQLAACGRPCQRLAFMDAKHGVVSDDLLYL